MEGLEIITTPAVLDKCFESCKAILSHNQQTAVDNTNLSIQKKCPKCGKWKRTSEFHKDKSKKDEFN